jgi:hypothetical protein
MLLGGPQKTIKSHLVFTALFCFSPFSVFFSRMSAPYCLWCTSAPALLDGGFFRQISPILADLKVVWRVKNISRGFLISGRSGGILAVF